MLMNHRPKLGKPPHLNQIPITSRRHMWTNETLEATMDVVERRTCYLRRANRSWNILLNSLFDHLNGKTRSRKMGLGGVLTKKKDIIVVKWTLDIQECGLSTSLQQLKMNIAKLTQIGMHYFEMEYHVIVGGIDSKKNIQR
jgi:hypothetical protein